VGPGGGGGAVEGAALKQCYTPACTNTQRAVGSSPPCTGSSLLWSFRGQCWVGLPLVGPLPADSPLGGSPRWA